MLSSNIVRWCGLIALVGGVFTLLLAPTLAIASFNLSVAHGASDPPPLWLPPLRNLLGGLLTFASPSAIYATYGKLFFLVYVLLLPGVVSLHLLHRRTGRRLEQWGFVLLVVGLAMSLVGDIGGYWDDYLGMPLALIGILEIPGLLMTFGASGNIPQRTVYGWFAALPCPA